MSAMAEKALQPVELGPSAEKIIKVTEALKRFLLEKNRRYGDSALNPIRIFSKLGPEEGIAVRIDDKLSRIKNGETLKKNDVVDFLGYLALECVSKGWDDFSDLLD